MIGPLTYPVGEGLDEGFKIGQGANHNAWNVVPLNASTAQQGEPTNATVGQRVMATQGLGGLQADMSGCLASPAESVPAFVNQFNLTVDHWLSFMDDDAAWMEHRTPGSTWQLLVPTGGYGNTSNIAGVPTNTWAGQSSGWEQAHLLSIPWSNPRPRWKFGSVSILEHTGLRYGWFVDNFTLSNLAMWQVLGFTAT